MEAKFHQEEVSVGDLKPWNQQTMAPPQTSLWEKLGSPGFIFAMLGSSFSAMPMNTALAAGGAAINAINQGDMEAYNRAFDEWKVNSDLAIKRHAMEQAEFDDIMKLHDKRDASWRDKMVANATKYGDLSTLSLLNNGMDKEALDAREGRNKAMKEYADLAPAMLETHALINGVHEEQKAGKDITTAFTDTVAKIQAAKYSGRYGRTAAGAVQADIDKRNDQWDADNPNASVEERNAAHDKNASDVVAAHHPIEAKRAETASYAQTEKERHDKAQEDIAAGKLDATYAAEEERHRHNVAVEAEAEIKRVEGAKLSGNRADMLRAQVDAYDNSLELIDSLETRIRKNAASVGVAGKVLRGKERLSDVLAGSKETERVQIMRDLERLKLNASRLLLDASGRPLSVSEHRIDDIIGGGSFGDLTANTLRSLDEVKKEYSKMRDQHQARLKGAHVDIGSPETTTNTENKPDWGDFPEVK